MDEKLLKFAYDMAFRDATLRKAFSKRKDEKDYEFQERKEAVYKGAFDYVKKYIDGIFLGGKSNPIEIIKELANVFNDKGFTFGNSQKLVNMTAKYMYLTTYGNDDNKGLFRECHCPMDRVMIDYICDNSEEFRKKYKYITWSTLDLIDDVIPEAYNAFQEEINKFCKDEDCIPLEFDYLHWDQ